MSTNGNEKHVKVMVLGSGPAGLSAALYAARAELEPVVLTGMQLGGQAALTYTIENYPGFPEGVGGAQLGELFQKQAERFGAKVEFEMAHQVDRLEQRVRQVLVDRPRRFLLRHVRWLVLQGQKGGDRGGRRQCARGRSLHHALCLLRDHHPPSR